VIESFQIHIYIYTYIGDIFMVTNYSPLVKICIDIMLCTCTCRVSSSKRRDLVARCPLFWEVCVLDICRLPGSGLALFCKLLVDIGDVFAMTCLGSAQIIL